MGETAFATALASLAAEGVTAASMETDPTGEQRPIPVIDKSSLESFAADLTDAEEATEAETTWVPPFPMTPPLEPPGLAAAPVLVEDDSSAWRATVNALILCAIAVIWTVLTVMT